MILGVKDSLGLLAARLDIVGWSEQRKILGERLADPRSGRS